MMETVFHDVKFALRVFRKSPIFTAVVLLTLALGIGANTAIFSIVNAVLLRPLPFRDSNQLEKITFSNPGVGLRDAPFSVPEFEDLKSRAGVFEEVSFRPRFRSGGHHQRWPVAPLLRRRPQYSRAHPPARQ